MLMKDRNTYSAVQAFSPSSAALLNLGPGGPYTCSLMECGEDGDLTINFKDGTTATASFIAGANWSFDKKAVASVTVVSGLFHLSA